MKNQLQFLIYKISNDKMSINALIKDEIIWLTQKGNNYSTWGYE